MAQVGVGFLLGSCLLASCASAPAAPTKATPTSGSKGVHAPVTEAAILERLEAGLKNSAMGTSLPRLVIGDVAYPRSPDELEALGGMALLLVTACSQDQAELPLQRVSLMMGDRSVDLPLVAVQKRELPLGPLRHAFGPRRVDSVYLLPVSETRSDGQIAVQFRGQMYWWGLLKFPSPPGDNALPQAVRPDAGMAAPQEAALHKLMREEFPLMAPDGP